MAELGYGDFDLRDGYIVVEDVAYDDAPDGWERSGAEDGVRGDTFATLTLTRQNVVLPARTGTAWNGYADENLEGAAVDAYVDARYVVRQTWTLSWGEAFMGWCMRDHLMTLYTLQKAFWLAFDDEMSRECATLEAVDSERKAFVAPTYPIAFYRAGDPDGQYSQDHVYAEVRVDGEVVDWQSNPYRIDPEIGLVAFETAVAEGSLVTLKYLWRAFVRIKELRLDQKALARHVYTGAVTFEQVSAPLQVERFDDVATTEPCRDCDNDDARLDGGDDEIEPPPASCGCEVDGPPEEAIANSTLTCVSRLDHVVCVPYEVPTDHYVHGVEVAKLEMGCTGPFHSGAVAVVGVRLMLDKAGSTYSAVLQKSAQPTGLVDHAYLNMLDSTSDYSWGGPGDCWGKPVGGWTPAMVNAYGFVVEVAWDVDPSFAIVPADWSYVKSYEGHAVGDAFGEMSCGADFDDAWGSAGENTESEICCNGIGQDGQISLVQDGYIEHNFTWVGSGDPPAFLDLDVTATALAEIGPHDPAGLITQTADNGLGDPAVEESGRWRVTSSGTHRVRVPVVGGAAVYKNYLHTEALQGPPYYPANEPCSGGIVTSVATVADCVLPQLDELDLVVHHSSVCAHGPYCYETGSVSGWDSPYTGEDCDVAVSSEGSLTGAFGLVMAGFGVPALGANSKVVGVELTGEYRYSPQHTKAGYMTVKAHIGSYDAGRVGLELAYPESSAWADFSVGGNGEFWDYTATFAETGVEYPTATGSELNALFQMEILGENDSGYAVEFRNLRATVYYVDVCDGL